MHDTINKILDNTKYVVKDDGIYRFIPINADLTNYQVEKVMDKDTFVNAFRMYIQKDF